MKQIFSRSTSYYVIRLVIFASLAIALLVLNIKTNWLTSFRHAFISVSAPMYRITDFPSRIGEWVGETMTTRRQLQIENDALKARNFVLQQQLQTMAALIAENSRLSDLLNASRRVTNDVVIANLIGMSPDPRRQELLLDKGSDEGVKVGQAVVDSDGLVGQVVEVSSSSCRILMIVDREIAVPVQNVRTGVRTIAEGSGATDEMRLRYITATADIAKDDVFVSSGLDKHYPPNYPVAKVASIERDEGQQFLDVRALPLAQLNRSRHFLVLIERKSGAHP